MRSWIVSYWNALPSRITGFAGTRCAITGSGARMRGCDVVYSPQPPHISSISNIPNPYTYLIYFPPFGFPSFAFWGYTLFRIVILYKYILLYIVLYIIYMSKNAKTVKKGMPFCS